jgi:hypothetical protein
VTELGPQALLRAGDHHPSVGGRKILEGHKRLV